MTRKPSKPRGSRPAPSPQPSSRAAELTNASPPIPLRWRISLPLVLLGVVAACYVASLPYAFLFDDHIRIVSNDTIRTLGPIGKYLGIERPVVTFSLALNYAVGGLDTRGYRAANIAIHALAGLTLFGLLRRLLLRNGFRAASTWLAFVIALIWVVHPLQTQSVTYVIQRAESMMGLFYVLTLYCLLRGSESDWPTPWYVAAVGACALGMGSKEVMVTAPLVVILFDRVFLSRSWSELWDRRAGFYLALAATGAVLLGSKVVTSVFASSASNPGTGFGVRDITAGQYLMTQPGVILHYIRLSLWPSPLVFDYNWEPIRDLSQATVLGIIILVLLALTAWGLVRKPALGFVGAWFFLVLAPTSSFIPIKDPIFEHRMYLPLISVVVLVVLFVYNMLVDVTSLRANGTRTRRTVGALFAAVAVASLAVATVMRNRDYRDPLTMWRDVAEKRPTNFRALLGIGGELLEEGNDEDAEQAFRKAVDVNPKSGEGFYYLGNTLLRQKRHGEAADALLKAVAVGYDRDTVRNQLGIAYKNMGELEEAIAEYEHALERNPKYARAMVNLCNALLAIGDMNQAEQQCRAAIVTEPSNALAYFNLAMVLAAQHRYDEAVENLDITLRLDPSYDDAKTRKAEFARLIAESNGTEAAKPAPQ